MSTSHNRLKLLDAFRGIAILMVIGYHFFSRFTFPTYKASLYPYSDKYADLFRYGFTGVDLFFIISGFVIFFSIEKTVSFREFIIKRWIRLFPTMLICSIVTFVVSNYFLNFLHSPFTSSYKAFVPSLLFIEPEVFYILTKDEGFGWINGSYWSLWVEVQFYFLIGILYFKYLKHVLHAILYLTLTGYVFYDIIFLIKEILIDNSIAIGRYFSWVNYAFDLSRLLHYLPLFTLGMLFYWLSQNRPLARKYFIIQGILTLHFIWDLATWSHAVLVLCFMLLFILCIYKPLWLSFLNNNILSKIGLCSYGLYIIHENIGVSLIYKYSDDYGLFAAGLIILLVLISYLYYLWERKVIKKLNDILINKSERSSTSIPQ